MITKKKTSYEAPELTITVITTESSILRPSDGTGERFGNGIQSDYSSNWSEED